MVNSFGVPHCQENTWSATLDVILSSFQGDWGITAYQVLLLMEEILHQLTWGISVFSFDRVSYIMVVQDFFHQQYECDHLAVLHNHLHLDGQKLTKQFMAKSHTHWLND